MQSKMTNTSRNPEVSRSPPPRWPLFRPLSPQLTMSSLEASLSTYLPALPIRVMGLRLTYGLPVVLLYSLLLPQITPRVSGSRGQLICGHCIPRSLPPCWEQAQSQCPM